MESSAPNKPPSASPTDTSTTTSTVTTTTTTTTTTRRKKRTQRTSTIATSSCSSSSTATSSYQRYHYHRHFRLACDALLTRQQQYYHSRVCLTSGQPHCVGLRSAYDGPQQHLHQSPWARPSVAGLDYHHDCVVVGDHEHHTAECVRRNFGPKHGIPAPTRNPVFMRPGASGAPGPESRGSSGATKGTRQRGQSDDAEVNDEAGDDDEDDDDDDDNDGQVKDRFGKNQEDDDDDDENDDDDEEEEDDEDADDDGHIWQYDAHKKVVVGICAMDKKAQSKPMKEILRRLEDYFEYIETLVFEESVILNKPIEEWPLCDCLISFHSKGFPLSKAIEYARLRRPFLINDLDIQYDIQDRRKVYKILEEAEIELPNYAVLDRDSANPQVRELVESDDHIEVAGVIFNKPFVEKPISAEDHNICIYYPAHAGGGSQRLFRKIGCRSSVYSNESHVRKTGSYIYEEFMPTDGTDVKVYTAGPDYAHAEARKSPALDGKVERDKDGKEIRYPVILTNTEKLIARKVCLAFKQTVCGFDLLRANGRSYVCDVNGFSFVKSSQKYYEDCSKILGNMMLRSLAPQLHIPWSIPFQLDDPPIVPTTFGRMMELRCVIAVIRHGDRTPKQKMKLEVKHSKFFELYHKYGKNSGQAKLKKPKQLQEVLDIARFLLGELPEQPSLGEMVVEPRVKLKQLKSVLEMYGHFSGINRKVQLKYQPNGRPRRSSSEDETAREPSLVLILKWGGELTPAGRVQAEDLGRCFRRLYPASGDYSGPQGLGLLRLHSTFRHDLKIYASDEGRVQMTAAAFAKGFLALEGELTPILFQMVKSANTNGLLDNDCDSSKCQKLVKDRLHNIMQKNQDLSAEDRETLNPTRAPSIEAAIKFMGNPYEACEKVHKLIKELNGLIKSKRQDNSYTQEYHLYHGETWDLLQRRWAKLEKDFKFPRTKRFDISKIPDIYDCIKYDLQHNQHTLQFQFAHELHNYAKALADIVIPQEYGLTAQEKMMISLGTCSPLLRKIQADLLRNADSANEEDETESVNRLDPKYSHGVSSPDRHVRTRLYFTSESHIHSLVTALRFGGLLDSTGDEQWQRSMEFLSAISELNYLSQIVIMLYEDPTKEPTSNDRFHVEIHFSSGVINRIHQRDMPTEPQGPGFRPHLHNKSYSSASSAAGSCSGEAREAAGAGAGPGSAEPGAAGRESPSGLGQRLPKGAQAQGGRDAAIKEELTDDEGDSRKASQTGSARMSPGGARRPPEVVNADELGANEAHCQPLNLAGARRLAMQSQRCLSRSYSATTPISLQDIFRAPKATSGAAALAPGEPGGCDEGLANEPVTSLDGAAAAAAAAVESGSQAPEADKPPAGPSAANLLSALEAHLASQLELGSSSPASSRRGPSASRAIPCPGDPTGQLLPLHQCRRRCHNQLPQGYHTIHQLNLSPSAAHQHQTQASSASVSTSPQCGGSGCGAGLQQRYAAHKQAAAAAGSLLGAHKKSFTMSASMPIQYKAGQSARACSVADVSQYCGGPSSLISTAVISGSSPELVAVCPYSASIRPLETLHNELSLKQFNDFIARLTRNHKSQTPSQVSNSSSGNNQAGSGAGAGAGAGVKAIESSLANAAEATKLAADSAAQASPAAQQVSEASPPTAVAADAAKCARQGRPRNPDSQQGRRPAPPQLAAPPQPAPPAATAGPGEGFSGANSLSGSLVWSGPPSSRASSGGLAGAGELAASPSAVARELWSKLELEAAAELPGQQVSEPSPQPPPLPPPQLEAAALDA